MSDTDKIAALKKVILRHNAHQKIAAYNEKTARVGALRSLLARAKLLGSMGVVGAVPGAALGGVIGAGHGALSDDSSFLEGLGKGSLVGAGAGAGSMAGGTLLAGLSRGTVPRLMNLLRRLGGKGPLSTKPGSHVPKHIRKMMDEIRENAGTIGEQRHTPRGAAMRVPISQREYAEDLSGLVGGPVGILSGGVGAGMGTSELFD